MTAAGDERLQLALDAAGLGSFVWHPAEDRAEPDAWTLALFGLAAGSTLTLSSVIFPADRERYAAAVARALDPAGRGELREDIRIVRPDGAERWLALTGRTAFAGHPPRAVRMSGVVADITDRKMADECQRYLLKLADALRPLADPVAVEVEATRLLGEHLGVSRALYCEVEPDENSIVVRRDYTAAGVPSFAGRFRVGDFGAFWADGYRAGKTMATADARTVPRADPAEFEAAGFRASVGVPVNKGGRLVGILVVHSATPRDWTADEVAQVEETAERTWAAVDRARAEVAVRVSEERFRALAEAVPSVVWTNDGGRIDSFNPHTYAYTGLDPAALTGDGWQGVVHPDDRPAAAARWARALAAGEPYRADYRLRRADGAYRWHLARAVRLPDSDRWVGVATDVDDLRRAVAAVRASESRLRAVAANLPSGAIFVVGPDLRYQLAAGLALGPAGFAVADLEGRAVADVMPPDMVATYEAYYRQALAGGTFRTEHAAHGRHYVTHGAPLRDPGGAVTAALAVSYDITDRVLAEQARRASEERFRTMFDLVPDLLWEGRADGFTDWYNRRWLEYTGQTAAEAAGWGWVAAIHPDDRARSRDTYQRGVTTGTPVRQEHRIRRHDGEYRWFLVKAAPVPAAGTAVRWFGAATDVHDERVAAQAVRQAEEQLRLALQAARMGIWRWDVATGTHLRDANLNRLLGLAAVPSATPLAEFLAHVYPDDHADVVDAFGRTARREAKMSLEFRAVWPDGSVHWLRDQGDVFGVGDGRYLTGVAVDVTDLKEAETALRHTRDELEVRVAGRTAELYAAVRELEAEAARRAAAEAARHDLLARLTVAQEEERTRIARELHDSLGQYLTGMALGLANLRHRLPADWPERAALQRLTELSAQMGREAHRLAVQLRPTVLDDAGLDAAVQTYTEEWSARTGIPAQFGGRGFEAGKVPEPATSAAYRAVQECLTNVANHSGSTHVSVLLDRKPAALVVIVEDDGRGFDPAALPADARRRLGLLGMGERVALAGGTIEVETAPGVGVTVYIHLPVPADPPRASSASSSCGARPTPPPTPELSEREAEVVRAIDQGYSNKEIAGRLGLSVKTVETYKSRSLEKLGVQPGGPGAVRQPPRLAGRLRRAAAALTARPPAWDGLVIAARARPVPHGLLLQLLHHPLTGSQVLFDDAQAFASPVCISGEA